MALEVAERRLFVCLAVRDLARSMGFFSALGFQFDPTLTDRSTACMIFAAHARVFLLAPRRAGRVDGCLSGAMAFSCNSKREVDDVRAKALSAGADADSPVMDLGDLYSAKFRDLDGYHWEAVWTCFLKNRKD